MGWNERGSRRGGGCRSGGAELGDFGAESSQRGLLRLEGGCHRRCDQSCERGDVEWGGELSLNDRSRRGCRRTGGVWRRGEL